MYSNEAKTQLLDVPAELIREHGAVSEPVGLAMAEGIKVKAHAGVGVGVTGIAGPTGGSLAYRLAVWTGLAKTAGPAPSYP